MSLQASGSSFVGNVAVYTTDHRGFNAEEMANMTVDKIIFIGQNSHPAIIEKLRHLKSISGKRWSPHLQKPNRKNVKLFAPN